MNTVIKITINNNIKQQYIIKQKINKKTSHIYIHTQYTKTKIEINDKIKDIVQKNRIEKFTKNMVKLKSTK